MRFNCGSRLWYLEQHVADLLVSLGGGGVEWRALVVLLKGQVGVLTVH